MNTIRQGILNASVQFPENRDVHGIQQDFIFPASFAGFDGHFPGDPVLPAVVQISLGIVLVERLVNLDQEEELDLKTVRRAKFVRKISPEERITGLCTRKTIDEYAFEVVIKVGQETASMFILDFSEHQPKDIPCTSRISP